MSYINNLERYINLIIENLTYYFLLIFIVIVVLTLYC